MKTFIDRVKEQTANNDHSEAVITLALYLNIKYGEDDKNLEALNAARAVSFLHMFYGQMVPELLIIRETVKRTILDYLTEVEAEAFRKVM